MKSTILGISGVYDHSTQTWHSYQFNNDIFAQALRCRFSVLLTDLVIAQSWWSLLTVHQLAHEGLPENFGCKSPSEEFPSGLEKPPKASTDPRRPKYHSRLDYPIFIHPIRDDWESLVSCEQSHSRFFGRVATHGLLRNSLWLYLILEVHRVRPGLPSLTKTPTKLIHLFWTVMLVCYCKKTDRHRLLIMLCRWDVSY